VPAVILRQLPRLELGTEVLLPVISPWLFFRLHAARRAPVRCAPADGWPREVQGALLLLVPLAKSTSYLGFPMTRAFFGEAGMIRGSHLHHLNIGTGMLLNRAISRRTIAGTCRDSLHRRAGEQVAVVIARQGE
jgi:hypothetical protein